MQRALISQMEGVLFKYGPYPAHVAFRSGGSPPQGGGSRDVVMVGGLTDGILYSKYVPLLGEQLRDRGIGMVQPLLTSSHQGWGMGSVTRDAEELNLLTRCLKAEYASTGVVICGQSTGCQDAVVYAQKYKSDASAAPLLGVILQAPVSDREWLATQPDTAHRTAVAQALVDTGRPKDVAFRALEMDGAAITASRWLSLAASGGEDDMFSSDLSIEELTEKLSALSGIPTLVLISGSDEYVPPSVDKVELGNRFTRAIGPSARLAVIEGGNHGLSEHAQDAADIIEEFVASLQ